MQSIKEADKIDSIKEKKPSQPPTDPKEVKAAAIRRGKIGIRQGNNLWWTQFKSVWLLWLFINASPSLQSSTESEIEY